MKSTKSLKTALAEAKNGAEVFDAIESLSELADGGNIHAKRVLADHASGGGVHAETACCFLTKVVSESDVELAEFFRCGLSNPSIRYWSILGYIKILRRAAYKELLAISEDTRLLCAERSHAVKCLAMFSKQRFDRGLPADPGGWNETDLRLDELSAWASAGFPDGPGYSEPMRDHGLLAPTTPFENIVSRIENELANIRRQEQDLAAPSNWLTPASPADINAIKEKWTLPSIYLEFLTRFSPLNVTINNDEFYNGGLSLYGASELIRGQHGYAVDAETEQPISDWPAHYVVIAYHAGDPFVLNLDESNGTDAPIETAEHGCGTWEFARYADSFCCFLEELELNEASDEFEQG